MDKVTAQDIQRVASRYLTLNNELRVYSKPTLTFTQLIVLIIVITTIIGWLVFHLQRRRTIVTFRCLIMLRTFLASAAQTMHHYQM